MPLHPAAADLQARHRDAMAHGPGSCQVEARREMLRRTSAGRQDQSGPCLLAADAAISASTAPGTVDIHCDARIDDVCAELWNQAETGQGCNWIGNRTGPEVEISYSVLLSTECTYG